MVQKYGTIYQNVGRNTNLIFVNTFHWSTGRKKFKAKVPESIHWYFTIIVTKLINHFLEKKFTFLAKKRKGSVTLHSVLHISPAKWSTEGKKGRSDLYDKTSTDFLNVTLLQDYTWVRYRAESLITKILAMAMLKVVVKLFFTVVTSVKEKCVWKIVTKTSIICWKTVVRSGRPCEQISKVIVRRIMLRGSITKQRNYHVCKSQDTGDM